MSGVFEMNMTTILLKSLSQDISIIFCHIKKCVYFSNKIDKVKTEEDLSIDLSWNWLSIDFEVTIDFINDAYQKELHHWKALESVSSKNEAKELIDLAASGVRKQCKDGKH